MKKFLSVIIAFVLLVVCILSLPSMSYAKDSITTPVSTLRFVKGASNTLVVYVNGSRAGSGSVSFSSDNKPVASVDSTGKVSAKKKGKAVITIKLRRNKSVKKKITINVVSSTSFSITPESAPLNGAFLNYSTYNKYTKSYYTIRSYMEYFEKHSGCSLRLKKGEYKVTNVIYVPSNTTVKLSDGVVIKKASKTGTKSITASCSLFMLCAPSKASTKGAYSGYKGVHDVSIKGYGNAKIDMKNSPSEGISVAVVMGHNKNVTISGIEFANLQLGHFIELDASRNVNITNCSFKNQLQPSANSSAECINLDTPDNKTNGFHQTWTSYDNTPDDKVTIKSCSFYNVQRAIGTHQYSKDKYHTNVTITDCSFKKCLYGGVYMMNWKKAQLLGNTFNGIGKDTKGSVLNSAYLESDRAFLLAGCSSVTIKNNSFSNCFQIGAVTSHQANGYPAIFNKITDKEFEVMQNENSVGSNVDRPFIRAYNNWDGNNARVYDYYVG